MDSHKIEVHSRKSGRVLRFKELTARALVGTGKFDYMTAEIMSDDAEEISPRTGKPKRVYKRRDMQAEA